MNFKIGDFVTRNSYKNDVIFKITSIENEVYYLCGVNIRLCADSKIDDLKHYENKEDKDELEFLNRIKPIKKDRDDYFYLPGKILHIDSDLDFLNRCLNYYNTQNIMAAGILEEEKNVASKIKEYLEEYKPNIVVITGHDAYYKKNRNDINSYKNSAYFVEAVKKAREVENSHQKLVIIAGGCQSDYEELIKAGANFASSPKRINIHALDPAIIASKLSLSDITEDINLKGILEMTKYGSNGMGGIKTKGTMYIGYPR